ncbi:hypothetical protein FHX37_3203 [Haloactinospora alba]|uniref:Chaplin domain-containing protein n=1 Tax=Haloactinospora alba TaxID=405555 RepID=A0A543NMY8_9ACTN|nr:hypothetical protein [Haloactinospora alba]TQN33200.1 hypothetical protein FHX37_3203 [Haloactinospora alba]
MRKWVRTSAHTALLTAGFVALGAGVSFADSHPSTSGNGSVLGGNQLVANADVPVNLSGNAIGAVGGIAGAKADHTGAVVHDKNGDISTSGNGSLVGGNQAVLDGDVPVNVTGNSVGAVLGTAGAAAEHSGAAVIEGGHGDDISTSGNGSAVGGNQLVGDLDVPVNASGNAIGAVGGVAGAAAEDTGALVKEGGTSGGHARHAQAAPTTGSLLDRASEVAEPLHAQTDSVDAGPVLHQTAGHGHGDDISTSGNGSLLGGNQAVVDLDVPVNASGNAIGAVGGVAGAAAEDTGAIVSEGAKSHSTGMAAEDTSGVERESQTAPTGEAQELTNELPDTPVDDTLNTGEQLPEAPAGETLELTNELPAPSVDETVDLDTGLSESGAAQDTAESAAPSELSGVPQEAAENMPSGATNPVGQVTNTLGL